MGAPRSNSWSLAAAIRLPVNVSAPMITSNPIAVIVTAPSADPCRMYSEMPTRVAASAPSECESAVRCGTGVKPAGPRQDQEYGDRNGDRAPEDRPGGEALPGTVHLVALPLEHLQHAVRDQEAAHDIRRRARDGDGAEDRAEGTVVGAG